MENRNLHYASVVLAQNIIENLQNYTCGQREQIGESIIKFLYKWLYKEDNVYEDTLDYTLSEFDQHNKDCRYECYCCSSVESCTGEVDADKPNVLDNNIQNIIKILKSNQDDENFNEEQDHPFPDMDSEW